MYHSADDTAALGICVSGPADGASPAKRVDEARSSGPFACIATLRDDPAADPGSEVPVTGTAGRRGLDQRTALTVSTVSDTMTA